MVAPLAVDRLLLRGAADPDRARLRLERLLSAADLLPARLQAGEILVLRHLRDPLPGRLDPDRDELTPPQAWERAARSAIERAAARAARPAEGPVPASAEAVLFADAAELLACLARDWCAGGLGAWWWRAARPAARGPDDLRRALLAEPRLVAAALELLVAWGAANELVSALGPAASAALLDRVLEAFGLPDLIRALRRPDARTPAGRTGSAGPRRPSDAPAAVGSQPAGETVAPVEAEPPPWARVAPEAATAPCGRTGQALVGIALALRRVPVAVRSRSFAAAAHAWSAAEPPAETGAGAGRSGRGGRRRDRARPAARRGAARPTPQDGTAQPLRTRPGSATAPARREATETGVGGVFHLLTAAVDLGFYGDFTEPARPGIDLDPWDFLVLLGRRLLPDPRPADPLWPLLARLAGRDPDEPPGAEFRPPGAQRQVLGRLPWARRPAERWADRIAADLRGRLRKALGAEDDSRLASVLLARHARVEASAARVDVHFSLAQLPIEVRLAGLDRDPGFVPAAGRSIAFHFG